MGQNAQLAGRFFAGGLAIGGAGYGIISIADAVPALSFIGFVGAIMLLGGGVCLLMAWTQLWGKGTYGNTLVSVKCPKCGYRFDPVHNAVSEKQTRCPNCGVILRVAK